MADRRFFTHARPIFFDTPNGVWQLDSLHPTKGFDGRKSYEGWRRKVASELLEFVTLVSNGRAFGPAPSMSAIDVRTSAVGTRAPRLLDSDQWLIENPSCHYDPPTLDLQRPPVETLPGPLVTFTCPRCASESSERFYGPCTPCRIELRAKFARKVAP